MLFRSCPDWANPCKHIAAVYYLLAEQFDDDPFLIFKLRGRTKEEIIDALRVRRAQATGGEKDTADAAVPGDDVRPLEECLDSFWEAGDELDAIVVDPAPPVVENAVLRRLGDAPFSIGKANLVTYLPKAYEVAGRAARQKASGELDEERYWDDQED